MRKKIWCKIDEENPYSFAEFESRDMTLDMNQAFLTALEQGWAPFTPEANNLIVGLSEATTSVSQDQYDALWSDLSSLSALLLESAESGSEDLEEMRDVFYATLTLFQNLSYSNKMSLALTEDAMDVWVDNFLLPTVFGFMGSGNDESITEVQDSISSIFSQNGFDEDGMSLKGYIASCKSILLILSEFITEAEVISVKELMDNTIRGQFLASMNYDDTMALSTADTLTSSVSNNFGLIALPLSLSSSEEFINVLPIVYNSVYNLSDTQKSEMETELALSAKISEGTRITSEHIKDAWTVIQSNLQSIFEEEFSNDEFVTAFLNSVQTSYTTLVQNEAIKSANSLLAAKAPINNIWEEYIFKNPSTYEWTYAGDYVKDWALRFTEKLPDSLDQSTKDILFFAISQMLFSNNNESDGLSGNNFIQIGNEILLFLSHFLTQNELDEIATEFTNFVITFVHVENYINDLTIGLEIAAMTYVALGLIVATVVTAGAASPVLGTVLGEFAIGIGAVLTEAATFGSGASTIYAIEIGAEIVTYSATLTASGAGMISSLFVVSAAGLAAGAYGLDMQFDDSE